MPAPSEPRWLARALSVFTPVRHGEAVTALLLTLSLFLLLCAYYIIKPVREALILASESGAEYKAYMSGVIAFTLIFTVSAYGRLVDRLPRRRLMVGVSRFFALNLIVFLLVARIEALAFIVGLGFFVWVGVFNMMVISQFWSFANDLYAVEQGKRLFPLIAIGGSVGGVVGAGLTALLVPVVGALWMLVFAAVLLWICAWLFAVVDGRDEKEAARELAATGVPTREATALTRAFKMVVTERYLIAMALFALVFSLANTNSEYILSKLVKVAATQAVASGQIDAGKMGDYIGATYGAFFFYVNLLTFLLQAFVVSRIVRYVGVGAALFVLPVIALGNTIFVFFVPVLAAFRIGKTAENATDYSLNNTLRQMLWLVTNREEKYKAKQAVDTFFVRMGDVGSALLVGVGVQLLHLSVPNFALANAILIIAWIVIMVFVVREYRHRQALLEQAARAEGVAA